MPKQSDYRGAIRTLDVLRALNLENGATISRLSRATRISRAALYRILGSLLSAGYVRRRPDDGAIFLTSLVQSLSDGFKDEYWITEIAGPVMEDLQRRVVWPTDLAVYRNFAMKLVGTTRRQSPLVLDPGLVGKTMPLLPTAVGQAYVAFCSPPERKSLLRYLASHSQTPDGALARQKRIVSKTLQEVRKNGYACRYRNRYAGMVFPDLFDNNATIAVPIRLDGFAVASLGITFIASALTVPEAVKRHLSDLNQAAATIEQKLLQQRAAQHRKASAATHDRMDNVSDGHGHLKISRPSHLRSTRQPRASRHSRSIGR